MEDAGSRLANAIILQAVKDYRKALYILKRNPRHEIAKKYKAEVEQFFLSDWFGCLTDLDGKLLMKKIQREV